LAIQHQIPILFFDGIGKAVGRLWSPNLPSAYTFSKRTRRPAEDFFNAALNYWYGMLYSVVEGGLFAAGLDPYLGILHADEYQKPTLCFDLIEAFRPWIDRLLIQACLEKKLLKFHFTKNQYGYFLNKTGKAVLIPFRTTCEKKSFIIYDRRA
jgi:CRISPR-associated protein Cas1